MSEVKLLVYKEEPVKSYVEILDNLQKKKESLSSSKKMIDDKSCIQSCPFADSKNNLKPLKKPGQVKCEMTALMITEEANSLSLSPDMCIEPLEIISGYKSSKRKVDYKLMLAGICPDHVNKTYDVSLLKQKNNTDFSLNAESIPFYKFFDSGIIFPWEAKLNTYEINVNTCAKSLATSLTVFPDIEISLDIPLSMSRIKEIEQKNTRSKKNFHIDSKSERLLEIELSYSEDGRKWELSPSFRQHFSRVKSLQTASKSVFDSLRQAFDDSISFEIEYAKGVIHYDYKYKAKKSPFKVGSEWSLQVNISPLIACSATLELDELFLMACTGPISKVYSSIKKVLAYFGVEIAFQFIVEGSISIDVGLQKEVDSETDNGIKCGAGITGKIEADLKASADITTQIIISPGVEAGVKTGIEASGGVYQNSSNLGIDLNLKFLGVTFYYQINVSGGFKKKARYAKENTVGEQEWQCRIPLSGN